MSSKCIIEGSAKVCTSRHGFGKVKVKISMPKPYADKKGFRYDN